MITPIKVYKLRTMHPYLEYLQQYVFDRNGLEKGGKLKDDFRMTHWGRIFRICWPLSPCKWSPSAGPARGAVPPNLCG